MRKYGFWLMILAIMLLPMVTFAELKVHFIDVGQGDAILVQCDGESLLIDAGPENSGQTVNNYLKIVQALDIIDYVIATHEHDDHIGGMISALSKLSVKHVYSSKAISSSFWFQKILPVLHQDGLEISFPEFMESFQLGEAVVTFVNPLNDAENANDRSLAVRIEYGKNAVLLTADIEAEAETAILDSGAVINSDIIKIAHHGGNTSSTDAFVRAVSPQIAVISVGIGNKHGHPHAEPLRILQKYGTVTYRTDLYGSIVCTSNGEDWLVEVSKAR